MPITRARRVLSMLALTLALTLSAADARAQDTLTDVVSFLLTNQAVPTGDFAKDAAAARVTSNTLTSLLLVELATVPLSSAASGFVYRFDPALATMSRASESFGPFYTERNLTSGRGQISFGVTLQAAEFTSLDGRNLRDGRLVTSGRQFRDETAPFDTETLTLEIDSRTVTFFGNVGVHDRLDVGVALPLVTLSLQGQRLNVYRGETLLQARATAKATGFGDAALRAKYRVAGMRDRGISALGEVRLPTGSEEDLLGAGRVAWRGVLIGSLPTGRLAVQGNLGFTGGGLASEVQYRGAATYAAFSRVTLVSELMGRRIRDIGHIAVDYTPHPTIAGADTLRLIAEDGDTRTAAAVFGAKFNVGGTWLVNGHVLLPIGNDGLKSRPVFLIGVDLAISP